MVGMPGLHQKFITTSDICGSSSLKPPTSATDFFSGVQLHLQALVVSNISTLYAIQVIPANPTNASSTDMDLVTSGSQNNELKHKL